MLSEEAARASGDRLFQFSREVPEDLWLVNGAPPGSGRVVGSERAPQPFCFFFFLGGGGLGFRVQRELHSRFFFFFGGGGGEGVGAHFPKVREKPGTVGFFQEGLSMILS